MTSTPHSLQLFCLWLRPLAVHPNPYLEVLSQRGNRRRHISFVHVLQRRVTNPGSTPHEQHCHPRNVRQGHSIMACAANQDWGLFDLLISQAHLLQLLHRLRPFPQELPTLSCCRRQQCQNLRVRRHRRRRVSMRDMDSSLSPFRNTPQRRRHLVHHTLTQRIRLAPDIHTEFHSPRYHIAGSWPYLQFTDGADQLLLRRRPPLIRNPPQTQPLDLRHHGGGCRHRVNALRHGDGPGVSLGPGNRDPKSGLAGDRRHDAKGVGQVLQHRPLLHVDLDVLAGEDRKDQLLGGRRHLGDGDPVFRRQHLR
mmetsp:Transcript_27511/g.50771  ORF Transcript_27511/g.50771 Transcript_27511/m.50771 type:complete len:308 (+) Transcript_27511:412-1335(+)